MSVAVSRPMMMEAFLAWDEGQELRWEFDGIEPVAMIGGTAVPRNATVVSDPVVVFEPAATKEM